eukprot:Skav223754  [mRNA]  locus=scaffold3575:422889:426983:- [translate_table: standard]
MDVYVALGRCQGHPASETTTLAEQYDVKTSGQAKLKAGLAHQCGLQGFDTIVAPLGYFDPLGLSKDGDVETFRRRRESELKNGRVAMFATIGCVAAVAVAVCHGHGTMNHAGLGG